MFEKETEEIFRKNFPQYCLGEELLSPYWDLFESGVNFGYNKAKDIIRDYKIVVEGDHTTVCSVPEENRCINVLKLNEQAEQFLKEK